MGTTVRTSPLLVLSAMAGVGIALVHMLDSRSIRAKKLYLSQCDVALAHPKFASPDLMNLDFEQQTADGSADQFEQYEWYVARLIYVLDEILRLQPTPEWYSVADTQLSNHRDYLSSGYYAEQHYLSHYSPRVRLLIDQIRQED